MARAIFQMVVQKSKRQDMIDALKLLRDRTKCCLGYVDSSIEQNIEDARKLRFSIVLDNRTHMEKFLQSELLVSIFQLVEQSVEKPDIFVSWEDGTHPMAALTAVRTLRGATEKPAAQPGTPDESWISHEVNSL